MSQSMCFCCTHLKFKARCDSFGNVSQYALACEKDLEDVPHCSRYEPKDKETLYGIAMARQYNGGST